MTFNLLVANILMSVMSVIAAYMTHSPVTSKYFRYGCIVALLAEPLWIYVGYASGQWGLIVTSIAYSSAAIYGIKNRWFDKKVLAKSV